MSDVVRGAAEPVESNRLRRWDTVTEWPLALIAVAFLVDYSIHVLAQPTGRAATFVDTTILVFYIVFVADYALRLLLATDRVRWFTHHLFDLAVVAIPFLRPLRVLRLVVLIGALQRAIGGEVRGRVVIYTGTSAVLLVYAASLAILEAERARADSPINNFGDAVWWSISTITSVGYGDLAPVTGAGRVIATLLMVGGISLIGVITATVASWIVQRVTEDDLANQSATAAHIDALSTEIIKLRQAVERIDGDRAS